MPKIKEAPAGQLKITLARSTNGRLKKHKANAAALGLKRIGDTTVQPDNAATRGKIAAISFMLRVED